jgi:Na+/H+ antiporter NhaC
VTPVFISRSSRHAPRFTVWKLAILFLGAGLWVAGVMVENFQITAAAIIVVAIALVLGLVERRGVMRDDDGSDEEEAVDGEGR